MNATKFVLAVFFELSGSNFAYRQTTEFDAQGWLFALFAVLVAAVGLYLSELPNLKMQEAKLNLIKEGILEHIRKFSGCQNFQSDNLKIGRFKRQISCKDENLVPVSSAFLEAKSAYGRAGGQIKEEKNGLSLCFPSLADLTLNETRIICANWLNPRIRQFTENFTNNLAEPYTTRFCRKPFVFVWNSDVQAGVFDICITPQPPFNEMTAKEFEEVTRIVLENIGSKTFITERFCFEDGIAKLTMKIELKGATHETSRNKRLRFG